MQHDVVSADLVSEALAETVDEALELRIGEGVALAAALADRVVVMLAGRVRGLEARGSVDVEAVDQAQGREHLERAVHAGQPRRAPVRLTKAVVDLLGAQAAALRKPPRKGHPTKGHATKGMAC